jgi:hypothetical protein
MTYNNAPVVNICIAVQMKSSLNSAKDGFYCTGRLFVICPKANASNGISCYPSTELMSVPH